MTPLSLAWWISLVMLHIPVHREGSSVASQWPRSLLLSPHPTLKQ